jgi:hypothetical protein
MSVKGFIAKYFKGSPEEKVYPEQPTPPMVGSTSRAQIDYLQTRSCCSQLREHNEPKANVFHIFTDGACSNNGGKKAKGGIGVHFFPIQLWIGYQPTSITFGTPNE